MKQESKSTLSWKDVKWTYQKQKRVFRYQQRIYSASYKNQREKLKYLQRKRMNSFDAKLLAVRKVTTDNKGKRTPGIDKYVAKTDQEKMALVAKLRLDGKANPIRRVWITKPGKDELRPLGIPTLKDRAKQTLVVLALEPQWEAKFEPNSYGFRPGRCTQDAMEAIFNSLRVHKNSREIKGKHAFDADIAGCFDNIDHDYFLARIGQTLPQIKRQVHACLKAGVMTGFQATKPNVAYENRGTPQGGPLSSLLSNIALHGLENHLKQWVENQNLKHIGLHRRHAKRTSLGVVRYADDFVVLHKAKKVIHDAKTATVFWLACQNFQAKSQ